MRIAFLFHAKQIRKTGKANSTRLQEDYPALPGNRPQKDGHS
jgi:hypothetical protein